MLIPALLVGLTVIGIPLDGGGSGGVGTDPPAETYGHSEISIAVGTSSDSIASQLMVLEGGIEVTEDTCGGFAYSDNSSGATLSQKIRAIADGNGYHSVEADGYIMWTVNLAYSGTQPASVTGSYSLLAKGKTFFAGESTDSSAFASAYSVSGATGGTYGSYLDSDSGTFPIYREIITVSDPEDPEGPSYEVPVWRTAVNIEAHKLPG